MIVVTVVMISLTSIVSSAGFSTINSLQTDHSPALLTSLHALHAAIEELSTSAPGTSRVLHLKLSQGKIVVDPNGLTVMPRVAVPLNDPSKIVVSFTPSRIEYDCAKIVLGPLVTISGRVDVLLTVEPSAFAKKIRIEAFNL